jgi:hypothetical protein
MATFLVSFVGIAKGCLYEKNDGYLGSTPLVFYKGVAHGLSDIVVTPIDKEGVSRFQGLRHDITGTKQCKGASTKPVWVKTDRCRAVSGSPYEPDVRERGLVPTWSLACSVSVAFACVTSAFVRGRASCRE